MGAFIARYNGYCATCGKEVIAGQHRIRYGRKSGRGKYWHMECPPPSTPGYEYVPKKENEIAPEEVEPTPTPAATGDRALDALQALRDLLGTGGLDKDSISALVSQAVAGKASDLEARIQTGIERANSFVKEHVTKEVDKAFTERVPNRIEIVPPEPPVVVEGTHYQFSQVLAAVRAGFHPYLWGAPGGGKSYASKQVAEALSRRYAYLSLTPQYPESRVMGYKDATGNYQETLFYDFYRNGGLFCIDELDNSSAALLTALNSSLSNGLGTFPCGMVERSATFALVGTGNTTGKASPQFPDRRPFDMAFADRLYFIKWHYDEGLETRVVRSINDGPASLEWLKWVRDVRKWGEENMPRLIASPRAAYNGATMITLDPSIDREFLADAVLFKGTVDKDAREKVLHANPLPEVRQ